VQPRRDRCGHEKSDHRHRRLLRPRRERPRSCCAAQGERFAVRAVNPAVNKVSEKNIDAIERAA
jgi:hypothetical protein